MEYIKLEDGIAVEEFIESPTLTEISDKGICFVEQLEMGTLGKKYDIGTGMFQTAEPDIEEIIDVLSQSELIGIDAVQETNPIRHKLMMNLVMGKALSDEETQLSYQHMVSMDIMPLERLQELIEQTGLPDYIVE